MAATTRLIDERKRDLQQRLTDLGYEGGALKNSIERGEDALRVADEVSRLLAIDVQDSQRACDRAQTRYGSELAQLVAQRMNECRPRRPRSAAEDCMDTKLAEAEALLAGSNDQVLATKLCAVATDINGFFQRQEEVRTRLRSELNRWQDDYLSIIKERMKIERSIRILKDRQKNGDCAAKK